MSNFHKIVPATQLRKLEERAFLEGASESAYMEEAGYQVFLSIKKYLSQEVITLKKVLLLCGKGNNTGDAYVVGGHFLREGIEVVAFNLFPLDSQGGLAQKYRQAFVLLGGQQETEFDTFKLLFGKHSILVDGVFGTGIKGELTPNVQNVFQEINASRQVVISIDIPSGLNGETGEASKGALKASLTVTLGLAKQGLFLSYAKDYVGDLYLKDFGLPEKYLQEVEPIFNWMSIKEARRLLPDILPVRHKYQAGLVLNFSGSKGMMGAAQLSSYAALRSGAGIVKLFHLQDDIRELSNAPWELIKNSYDVDKLENVLATSKQADCLLFGPGIDNNPYKLELLQILLLQKTPLVIDAGGIRLFKKKLNEEQDIVLTPHLGELRELLNVDCSVVTKELVTLCQSFVDKYKLYLVVKGAITFIFSPTQEPWVVNQGVPGMATAGSGDVLAGCITAFIAQGLEPVEACKLGVLFHAISGSLAQESETAYAMVASSIIKAFPKAFHVLLSPSDTVF
ncbi:MAG: NAD(P)H-hydrate dehydratase [Chlamydiales bacterium]|nr:NAD(P)H-hydrate dehydratase [Chlamydiales bacterium]